MKEEGFGTKGIQIMGVFDLGVWFFGRVCVVE